MTPHRSPARARIARKAAAPPFPRFPEKHREDPLVTPARFLQYLKERGRLPTTPMPESVVFLFGPRLREHVETRYEGEPSKTFSRLHVPRSGGGRLGVHFVPGIGGPQLATEVEELAELGVRRFVIVGLAGSIQPSLPHGRWVLCTKALRDEGTSHHYLRPSRWVRPSEPLSAALRESLRKSKLSFVEGPSWTTDAPYRETLKEVRRYRKEGILTVEMEAATLFAVARYRSVESAALFLVSDVLEEKGWHPGFTEAHHQLQQGVRLALGTLRRMARAPLPSHGEVAQNNISRR